MEFICSILKYGNMSTSFNWYSMLRPYLDPDVCCLAWGQIRVNASLSRETIVTGGGGLAMPLTSVMSFLSNSSKSFKIADPTTWNKLRFLKSTADQSDIAFTSQKPISSSALAADSSAGNAACSASSASASLHGCFGSNTADFGRQNKKSKAQEGSFMTPLCYATCRFYDSSIKLKNPRLSVCSPWPFLSQWSQSLSQFALPLRLPVSEIIINQDQDGFLFLGLQLSSHLNM